MMCTVITKYRQKLSNKITFDSLNDGIKYMLQVLKNYNIVDKIYDGFWKKEYIPFNKRYVYKRYIVMTEFVSLELYTRGAREVDRSLFIDMIKAMEKDETF